MFTSAEAILSLSIWLVVAMRPDADATDNPLHIGSRPARLT